MDSSKTQEILRKKCPSLYKLMDSGSSDTMKIISSPVTGAQLWQLYLEMTKQLIEDGDLLRVQTGASMAILMPFISNCEERKRAVIDMIISSAIMNQNYTVAFNQLKFLWSSVSSNSHGSSGCISKREERSTSVEGTFFASHAVLFYLQHKDCNNYWNLLNYTLTQCANERNITNIFRVINRMYLSEKPRPNYALALLINNVLILRSSIRYAIMSLGYWRQVNGPEPYVSLLLGICFLCHSGHKHLIARHPPVLQVRLEF
ncbi:hypothetical protein Ciccas_010165 [Cichlidogyrus casuarinus]|uniref:Uncharacterized protein n=1 Tax=Cichlidogyrus casuarinus TaxID=1844966 RepID=A0ABD2PWH9_9PLAT